MAKCTNDPKRVSDLVLRKLQILNLDFWAQQLWTRKKSSIFDRDVPLKTPSSYERNQFFHHLLLIMINQRIVAKEWVEAKLWLWKLVFHPPTNVLNCCFAVHKTMYQLSTAFHGKKSPAHFRGLTLRSLVSIVPFVCPIFRPGRGWWNQHGFLTTSPSGCLPCSMGWPGLLNHLSYSLLV